MPSERQQKVKRRTLVGVGVGVIAVVAIVLMVALIPKRKMVASALVQDRIECPGFKELSQCVAKGCEFDAGARKGGPPACFMRRESFGYRAVEVGRREARLESRSADTPYGPAIRKVTFKVTHVTDNIVRITFRDSERVRYEVPVQKDFPPLLGGGAEVKKPAYRVAYSNETDDVFTFRVQRNDGTTLWDSSIGGLVLSDQFVQVAGYLPSRNLYGLGEHTHPSLRHDTARYATWPLFARDQPPLEGVGNLYGAHPFCACLENTTRSHGVLFLNSNAMEASVLPAPAISFRSTGGIIDLFFFVGDSPEEVVRLYTQLVGRPALPPYWALGFQLSRYGYNNLSSVEASVQRTRDAGIPQDVQFLDIDHMSGNRDFTFDMDRFDGLPEYMRRTKKDYGLKWIIILDPAIAAAPGYEPYESGLRNGVYVKRSPKWSDDIFPQGLRKHNVTYGKVWPREEVAFPDFFLDETHDWWTEKIVHHHDTLPFDGLWIDMNEPSNFGTNEDRPFNCEGEEECWSLKCPKSQLEDPPYNPLGVRLSAMTLCMESVHGGGGGHLHYDVHSLYGWSQSQPTLRAAQEATRGRSLVISRSTYPSSGRTAGHWLGDNKSTWQDMRNSIIGILEFNLFGIPYIGADVCGFFGDSSDELCARWMQLGAFYPFYRNHNGLGQKDQDPGSLGEDAQQASRGAVRRRRALRPYLYTLFHGAHTRGDTVLRPLFHEFPGDENTWDNAEQFMWGKCLLISPVLQEGAKSVSVYLPDTEWWDFKFHESVREERRGGRVEKGCGVREDRRGGRVEKGCGVREDIPLHARGGCIIPTEASPRSDHKGVPVLKVSLYIFPLDDFASGELFVDDGVSIDTVKNKANRLYQFTYQNCSVEVKRTSGEGAEDVTLASLHVFKAEAVEAVFLAEEEIAFHLNGTLNLLTVPVSREMKDISKIFWWDKEKKCQMSS